MAYYSSVFCGCYIFVNAAPKYLPQLKVNAHTTILDTTSRTTLTQTFINPYSDKSLSELKYVFPLYDGVSVVAFTCTVADRVIKGVVKEREKAKQVYNEATARGETAGLFEQSLEAADVFTTTIGNVPAGEKVKVEITYLGELKHDAEVDGVRFTIPTSIVPRYGSTQSLSPSTAFQEEGMTFTVDAEMPEGSAIKSIQSPSHPISVSIGTVSTAKASDEPSLRRASATLSQGTASIEADFIIQVVATKLGEPAAFVETHPTIPNQRALMATLVPKFKLPAEKPEIVFMCDRSGSMSGNIPDLVAALNIFLKSLPLGVKFNICSFGSSFRFLWNRSKTYSQDSLDEAVRHVNTFQADMGGTQMYEAFDAIFKQRYNGINLEVFLLTDGEIWDQDRLFGLVNQKVAETKGDVRVFTLGVGTGVSTSLIEGVARAGNGFCQTVGNSEKMDKKVVRMLKASLFPHIKDYSLEIKYEKTEAETPDEEEFEIVEKVFDSLSIKTLVGEESEKKEDKAKKTISLFDNNLDDDDDTQMVDAPGAIDCKYDHLPTLAVPRYLQTPTDIPPLFPFNRTTVYVLLSDSTPNKKPKSVILRGTSSHGPLELEIPIVNLAEKSETIHQLAARKEVKELEEGRGWLVRAKDDSGKLLSEKHEAHFSDMVEREAVRLGVEFQVGGKWCSFVAVEEHGDAKKDLEELSVRPANTENLIESSCIRNTGMLVDASRHTRSKSKKSSGLFGNPFSSSGSAPGGGGLFGSSRASSGGLFAKSSALSASATGGGGLFGNSGLQSGNYSVSETSGGLFGSSASVSSASSGGGVFGSVGSAFRRLKSTSGFGSNSPAPPPPPPVINPNATATGFGSSNVTSPPPGAAGGLFGASPSAAPPRPGSGSLFGASSNAVPPPPGAAGDFFGAGPSAASPLPRASGSLFGASPPAARSSSGPVFGAQASGSPPLAFGCPPPAPSFGMAPPQQNAFASPFVAPQAEMRKSAAPDAESEEEDLASFDTAAAAPFKESKLLRRKSASPKVDTSNALQALATLQTFVGSWAWGSNLEKVLGTTSAAASALALPGSVASHANKDAILATVCAVVYFKKNLKADKEAWEMLVEKAEAWLEDQIGGEVADLEQAVESLF